ncbi:hypothetical protein SAMN05216388_1001240 [Halorientalis persicus]|uniref:Uncharacterized protein n=1 Tax=Halorientalis persicus TaxID=1367881 RepID=A0A1H8DC79_9EURY|nr:hypothetical protein [Halorientalis persicus]SEN04725.1 hypothetical protein SAMN05216388_1001240 [Halorientalis persicus]
MPEVEFGSLDAANQARDNYADHLCPDDNRSRKTVTFRSDTPADVLEAARRDADDSRTGDTSGYSTALTDREKDQIDFSDIHISKAKRAKGIFLDEGVSDWLSYFSEDLKTESDQRQAAQRAARDSQGKRMDAETDAQEKAADSVRTAKSEECDHAAGHCAHGDPEACEFIADECGLDPERVLARREPEPRPEQEPAPEDLPERQEPQNDPSDRVQPTPAEAAALTDEEMGAISRAWEGYHGAIETLSEALESVREEWENAQQAAKAVNSIRQDNDQPPLHFTDLEESQAVLTDILRKAANDCAECHADHSGHDHPVTSGPRESIQTFVNRSAAATPVGRGRVEIETSDLPERGQSGPSKAPEQARSDDSAVHQTGDQSGGQFAQEQQGTLGVGVDPEATAEEKQVTLTGADATESNQAVPGAWYVERKAPSGAAVKYSGGPHTVEVVGDGDQFGVLLDGPDDLSFTVASGLRDRATAADVAGEFTRRVKPDEVSFKSDSGRIDTAAAESLDAAVDNEGGILAYAD